MKAPGVPMTEHDAASARQRHQAYWDAAAETKEFSTPLRLKEFAALVPPKAAILDIGCGYGRSLAELRAHGYGNLVGVDFSAEMIARGKNLHPGLDLRVLEGRTLPLPDQSVDAALLLAVLTCIQADAEQEALVAEILRVLKPGGMLHVNDFLFNTDARNLERYAASASGPYGCFTLPDGACLRHHSRNHLEHLLRGFEPALLEETVFTTMNGNRSNGFVWFGRKR